MQGDSTFTLFISQLHNHISSVYLVVLTVHVTTFVWPTFQKYS